MYSAVYPTVVELYSFSYSRHTGYCVYRTAPRRACTCTLRYTTADSDLTPRHEMAVSTWVMGSCRAHGAVPVDKVTAHTRLTALQYCYCLGGGAYVLAPLPPCISNADVFLTVIALVSSYCASSSGNATLYTSSYVSAKCAVRSSLSMSGSSS